MSGQKELVRDCLVNPRQLVTCFVDLDFCLTIFVDINDHYQDKGRQLKIICTNHTFDIRISAF